MLDNAVQAGLLGQLSGYAVPVGARHITLHCVRKVDAVARFGGAEFVVILSELDVEKTETIAQSGVVTEKIRAILSNPYLLKIEQAGMAETTMEHRCTSSIGTVLFLNHEAGIEEIIKQADMAMYQAKEAGGNSVHFSDF